MKDSGAVDGNAVASKVGAIVVAAGESRRMAGEDKIFASLM